MLQGTGIFVTKIELDRLTTEIQTSGMWLSGGRPMGDPQYYVQQLTEKYKPPKRSGLNSKTGEFMIDI